MCDISGLPPSEVFAQLRDAGLGSTPGTAAEVLHDGVRERISPNKLPVARWVEIIEASHRAGLRSTSTVMFGHIEEPWELAQHMTVIRELQERTGGITEFVPLSFIPFMTLLGPHARRRGDLPRGEPQAHRGLPPGAGPDDPQRPGLLGQDGPRRRDRGAALGRQRPRRDVDGGVDLAAWPAPTTACKPRPAAAGRRRPRGRAPGGGAHARCTTSCASTRWARRARPSPRRALRRPRATSGEARARQQQQAAGERLQHAVLVGERPAARAAPGPSGRGRGGGGVDGEDEPRRQRAGERHRPEQDEDRQRRSRRRGRRRASCAARRARRWPRRACGRRRAGRERWRGGGARAAAGAAHGPQQ